MATLENFERSLRSRVRTNLMQPAARGVATPPTPFELRREDALAALNDSVSEAAGNALLDTDELLAAGMAPGPQLVAAVQRRIDAFAEQYQRTFPAAVKCLLSDRAQLISYLRFPIEHHRRIRHSNFIERTFGKTRRRVKVIGRLPGEASCLNLVWAVLDRASRGWRGMTMTPAATRQLADLRHQLLDPPTQLHRPNDATADAPPENVGAVA